MTLLEAAASLRARSISSVELVEQSLSAVAKRDPELNAFITILDEPARRAAAQADADLASGIDRGPLHGIPIALKDVFATKGVRTTCGSKIFADHIPGHDSAVTEKLAAAGAILIGKTGLHELAYGVTSSNPHFGFVLNPQDPTRIPGGSSGGSAAAVVSKMVFMAMGSDTGGSIRLPAAFCGCVGLKPTSGRVSRYGVMPLDFSLDHMGPLTRTVRDAAVVMNAIAGHDHRDDTSSSRPTEDYLPAADVSIRGLKIGRPENFFFDRLDPAVRSAVDRMFSLAESLGATVVPVTLPDIAAINAVGRVILMSEASAVCERYLDRRSDFGADVLTLLDQGRLLSATDYLNAQRLRREMHRHFARLWSSVDLLFTPTVAMGAPRVGATTVEIDGQTEDTRIAATRLLRAFNVLGVPALSLPCGITAEKLPVGLQIVGRPFQESLVLRAAAALEAALR